MCEFRPGDEVVWVDSDGDPLALIYDLWMGVFNPDAHPLEIEGVLKVTAVVQHPHLPMIWGLGFEGSGSDLYPHFSYRKVQRRDLTAWLSTTNTIEEPKRKPAKAPA